MQAVRVVSRSGGPPRPLRRRHRPDHPVRLAEAGGAHRLRGRAVRRVARRPRLRPQPGGATPEPPSWWPDPTSVPAPRGSTPSGPSRTTGSRRSSPPASATSSATTARRPGLVPVEVDEDRSGAPRRRRGRPGRWRSPSTSNGARLEAPAAGIEAEFPLDEFTREPPAQRLGRHRPHPPLRGRDRGLRGEPSRLAADHSLSAAQLSGAQLRAYPPRFGRGPADCGACPPGPRRRLPRGAGGQPASGDPVDDEPRTKGSVRSCDLLTTAKPTAEGPIPPTREKVHDDWCDYGDRRRTATARRIGASNTRLPLPSPCPPTRGFSRRPARNPPPFRRTLGASLLLSASC